MPKYAVLSMDVEEWFHPDYLLHTPLDRTLSTLDGVQVFADILKESGIRGTFFVVAEIASRIAPLLRSLADGGHDVGCHGLTHVRPLDLETAAFSEQQTQARNALADILGRAPTGYRAPSFGLDDARFAAVRSAGFLYDASGIRSTMNPVYGSFSQDAFRPVLSNMAEDAGFFSFTASTQAFMGKQFPLGGGFFRMFPWPFIRFLLARYVRTHDLFVLYVHPSELSRRRIPRPEGVSLRRYIQSTLGRRTEAGKVRRAIRYLKKQGFAFATFAELCARYGGDPHAAD